MEALTDLVARIVELRKQQASPEAIADACRAGTVALLRARQSHRAAALASEATREAAAAAKGELDRAVLQLHSLLYEKQFYEREISACTNFTSAHPDAAVGVTIDTSGGGGDVAARARRHAATLAALAAELGARRDLGEGLRRAQATRGREAARLAALESQLGALRSGLAALGAAGGPLLGVLGPRLQMRPPPRGAGALPAPLWALHAQFAAARDALGLPIDVRIEGAPPDDAAAAAAAAGSDAGAADGGGAEGGDAGAAGEPAGKRRRAAAAAEDIYQVHPLSVVLSLLAAAGSSGQPPLLEVRFELYPRPGLVGACACGGGGGGGGGAGALAALFDGDVGDGEGYEVLAQLAGPGPYKFGTDAARARPYRWAQDLAGVDVIPSLPPAPAAADAPAAGLDALAAHARQQRAQAFLERLRQALSGAPAT
ncbi:MAG: THO complex, subunit 5 [Monoraphidium minutum]|nr:MAG: THO complex, subunit 5 [Monoraphidium minutum]